MNILYLNEYKKQARILHEKDGVPLFVPAPYDEYLRPKRISEDEGKVYLPHEVVISHTIDGKSLPRAWREHKGLSQEDVANQHHHGL